MALRALKGVRELRFLLCQHSAASDGLRYSPHNLRNYIASNYDSIRNSSANITVRESEYASPVAIATYSFGIEKRVNLSKKTESEIEKIIAALEAESESIASKIKIWSYSSFEIFYLQNHDSKN